MYRSLARLVALAPLLTLACGDDVSTTTATVSDSGSGTATTTGTATGTGTTGTTEPTTTAGSVSDSLGTTTSTTGTPTTTATTDTTSTDTGTTTGSTTDTTTGGLCVDGDGDGHGDGCVLGPDCDDGDPNNFTPEGCANCLDGDADSHWDGCDVYDDTKPGPDCDDTDPNNHTPEGCANCLDIDGDDHWAGCDVYDDSKPGPDCDDTDFNNHTPDGCANCVDMDGDGHWVGCDQYGGSKPGPDCDDADFNNHTPDGCANCVDMDNDGVWSGCDQYDDGKPGPDCDDGNAGVGLGDAIELCNGLAENCAGEIDPLPPDEMCPTEGNPPNVASWLCDPPAPGQDGCKIGACTGSWFDLNADAGDGCECEGTKHGVTANAVCGEQNPGALGPVSEGDMLNNLPVGTVPKIDNGIGGGAEDWYWVEFPLEGTRPNTGSIRVEFLQNDNLDYRFEVFRNCNGVPWAGGLATQFGAGAPPAREWWFFDNHPPAGAYKDDIPWPGKVYIRVFRVQNDNTCNQYRLRVERVAN